MSHPSDGPLRAAVAVLAIVVDEDLPAGRNIRIWRSRLRRNWCADAELDVCPDGVPGGNAADFELIAPAARERVEVGDGGLLGDAIGRHDQSEAARNRADIQFEVLFFVSFRVPVQSANRAARGVGLVEIHVLRNRALRPAGEDPHYVVGEAEGMAGAAGAPAVVGHATGDCGAARSHRVELSDGREVQLFAGLYLVLGRAGGRQVMGPQRGCDLLDNSREVDYSDIARDIVHDVGGFVGRVDHDPARIGAGRNLQHARRVGRIGLHRRRPEPIHFQLDRDVAGGAHHVGFIRRMFERDGPGVGDEPLGRAGLGRHCAVHINGLARVLAGSGVNHREQALRVDVETDRPVRRRPGVGQVREFAVNGDIVELVRICPGDEVQIGGGDGGRRGDSRKRVAGGFEAAIGQRIQVDIGDDSVARCRRKDRHVADFRVIRAVGLTGCRQRQKLRDVDQFKPVLVAVDGDSARLGCDVVDVDVDGPEDLVVGSIDLRNGT